MTDQIAPAGSGAMQKNCVRQVGVGQPIMPRRRCCRPMLARARISGKKFPSFQLKIRFFPHFLLDCVFTVGNAMLLLCIFQSTKACL
jgi:hypothetical protein